MYDIVGALLKCDGCKHAVTYHDGSGCNNRGCNCLSSKEQIVGGHIDIAISEHQELFRNPVPEATGDSAM